VSPYTELRCHSAFSFGDGACTPEALVARGAEMGYGAMGLTDTADLGGIIRFAQEAARHGVRPVIGAELRVGGRPLALLARNETGFRNLATLVTRARVGASGDGVGGPERGRPALGWEAVAAHAEGLHLLTGPAEGPVATLLQAKRTDEAERLLTRYRDAFGDRLAVEVQYHHVSGAEAALSGALMELARRSGVPWVVTNEPRYLDGSGRLVHDLLTALRCGTDVDEAARRGMLLPSGEWRLKSPAEMERAWRGRWEGLEESTRIAEACDFSLRWLRPPLPRFPVPPGHDDDSFLRHLVLAGARTRWGDVSGRHLGQIEHELGVIRRLGFAGFFLIMWDAVDEARRRDILCQGRGSAANSAVAYCLGITAVDPIANDLLFERFLSEVRTDGGTEAPDIDVDFEMQRREEILDYVYTKYSRQSAAITCTTQVYRAPSAFQDAMRALGYPAELSLAVSKRLRGASPTSGAELLESGVGERFGLSLEDARGRALLRAMRAMQDLPRMRSTHPGGFVLSREPLGAYIPIERTTMGRTILQFDKDDLDAAGVPKFDFLGLGGLSAIQRAFQAIAVRTGRKPELYEIPLNDKRTYQMISSGETVGTFQIESRAQIQSILQTRPEHIYDLVVQVALIRPGPIQGEFVHPYTRRRRGLETVTYPHDDLEPILRRTQGIPIFQEQAMSISMVLGGYTAAEADDLRRAMGHHTKRTRLEGQLVRLRARLLERGVTEEVAERIVSDLQIFANYGFPESHAWSFAYLAYATAWLKANHPAEFFLGLLNSWPMGFYPPGTLVQDARRHGVVVRPPCLRDGDWECTLEPGEEMDRPALRVGWRFVQGIGSATGERLRSARGEGPFRSVDDAVRRGAMSREEALQLARAGAFEAFEPGRRRAAWKALRTAGDMLPLAPARHLPFDPREMDGDERIFLDYLATGICVDGHPMEPLRARVRATGATDSREMGSLEGGENIVVAGLVVARQHPETAKGTVFLLLEDELGYINVIVPASLYKKNREVVNFSPFLLIEGRFEREDRVMNVVGKRFRRLRAPLVSFKSRDFQ
jgi:error-prone DNA polymerase